MAQDFGDEMGDSLRRAIGRAAGMAFREWMRERDFQRRLDAQEAARANGNGHGTDVDVAPAPEAQPDEVVLNFGESAEAERFAALCRKEGIDVTALTDADGRGFIRFAPGDLERVQDVAPEFAEVMTRLQIERVAKTLEAEPVSPDKVKELTEVKVQDAPEAAQPLAAESRGARDASTATEAGEQASHTERIAAEVRAVRPQCKTLDELERALAARGIGTTVSKDGEVMFYEPRIGEDGNFLPYSHERGDWAVGARTLKERYGVDASHDSFLARAQRPNEPQVADGSLDTDGRTPDLNQGIESHDGMDTDVSTLRIEREQNGTDVAPSEVREESARARDDDRSLDAMAKECRAASKQLEHESGIADRELDVSDKLNPVR